MPPTPKQPSKQPAHHVAFLVGPFRYPIRQEDVADELRARGWHIAERLEPSVDIIVLGTEPRMATCDGLVDGGRNDVFVFDSPGREVVPWGRLRLQLLCDDLEILAKPPAPK